MKKINLMIIGLVAFSIAATAQATPAEGTTEYNKVQVPCYTIEVPYEEDIAKDAIKKRFKQMGASSKERKDFMEFKNVSIPEVKQGLVDAYIKVERKSKKEKDKSIISMIITEPGTLPGTATAQSTAADGTALAAGTGIAAVGAMGLLSSLNDNAGDRSLELEIKKQEEIVKKADKDYNNLIKDGEDLQNKLKKTQNDIEANRNSQIKKAEELKTQKETLLQIQARRRILPGKE